MGGGPSGGTRSGGPNFPILGKVLHVPARRSVKDGALRPAGRGFPILGRFRLAELQSAKFFRWLETWPRRGGRAGRCTAEGRNRRKAKPITNRSLLPAGEPVRRRRVAAISGVGLWRIRHSPKLEWWLAVGRRIFRIREDSSTSAVSPAGRGERIPESGCFAGSRRVPRYLLKAEFRFGGIQGSPGILGRP